MIRANSYSADDFERLQRAAANLHGLTSSPHPGLISWLEALHRAKVECGNAIAQFEPLKSSPRGPNNESVGPWKECVYKHPDAPNGPLGGTWIPASERRPPARQWVLVVDAQDERRTAYFFGDMYAGPIVQPVKFWMPLPEVPTTATGGST